MVGARWSWLRGAHPWFACGFPCAVPDAGGWGSNWGWVVVVRCAKRVKVFISCEVQLPGKAQALSWEKGRMEVWTDLPAPGLGLGVGGE